MVSCMSATSACSSGVSNAGISFERCSSSGSPILRMVRMLKRELLVAGISFYDAAAGAGAHAKKARLSPGLLHHHRCGVEAYQRPPPPPPPPPEPPRKPPP